MKIFSLIQTALILFAIVFISSCSKSGSNPPPKDPGVTFAVTSLSISTGPYATSVTITGVGFSATAANNKVSFNGHDAVVDISSSTKIITSVPLGAGTGNISVTVDGKTVSGPVFTYQVAQVVSPFAGGSKSGAADGNGASASFFQPSALATDAAGNIYVADANNSLIRKITPDGTVTTIAGSSNGYADGKGTAAEFSNPAGIAVDAAGNIYVSDNTRIRKITPDGTVSTFAGNNSNQPVDGTGAGASFSHVIGLVVDGSGNLFVADQGAGHIRKITSVGVVTTIYGGTDIDPYQLVLDKLGNIYAADLSGNRIDKVTQSGSLTVFAGTGNVIGGEIDGTGSGASFYKPSGLAIDGNGDFLVIDSGNGLIRQITPAAVVTTFGGRSGSNQYGTITAANFIAIQGITVDGNGNIYFTVQNEIRKISMQ